MSAALSGDFAFAAPGGKGKGAAFDPSMLSVIPAEVVGAVTKSINGLDTSRRVAWAKMYAALERGEQAQRDLNVCREDREMLSALAGFAYAVIETFLGTSETKNLYHEYLPKADLKELQKLFPEGALNDGADRAQRWIKKLGSRIEEIERYISMLDARRQAEAEWLEHCTTKDGVLANDPELKDCAFGPVRYKARQRERRDLAEFYGFTSQTEMLCWLAQYKAANE